MKPANKIFYSVISAKLLAIGLVIVAAAAQSTLNTQAAPSTDHHLGNEQIVPCTTEHTYQQIQTIVIAAKRLTTKEKLAMDMEHARTMQANAQFNKAIRKTA